MTMSAKTPAGSVKRNNGRDATVDIIDRERAEGLSVCITHTAAVSCAATHVPEIKLASHSLRKTGFRNAVKVDSLLEPLLIRIAKLNTEPAGFIPISVSPAAFSESTAGNARRCRGRE